MATKIADVIVPEVFNPYVVQRTAELSAIQQSGIISTNEELDRLAKAGGKLINMPFWEDLNGEDEVLSDSAPLTVGKITSDKDVAVLLMRGKAWGVNDLAKALSGDDPMKEIGDLIALYWARRRQYTLFEILKGVFASPTMVGNVHDVSSESGDAAILSGNTFIDAQTKLGDAANKLTAVGLHSYAYASLRKQNLIEFIPNSEGLVNIPTYMGKSVIVDDGCPFDSGTGVFTSYLFGLGAVGLGNGEAPVPTETDRDSLQGDDILINRQHFILHPRGVKFANASVAGASPTNAELAMANNWDRVYENKNIRIVQFKHKI